jgi:hypothetical protein
MTETVKKMPEKKRIVPGSAPAKLQEFAGFNISTHIKISDPNTGQVLVQKRGDT